MAVPKSSFSELYTSACTEHQVQTNPHILEVLETTPLTGNITLNLSGRKWQTSVQKLDDKDAFVLSKCLRNSRLVAGLDVSYNHITDEGVKHLADLLRGGCLSCLRLSGNKIGDSGAMLLAGTLQGNKSLMELELSACDLGIQSIITFANALKSNHNAPLRGLQPIAAQRPRGVLGGAEEEPDPGHRGPVLQQDRGRGSRVPEQGAVLATLQAASAVRPLEQHQDRGTAGAGPSRQGQLRPDPHQHLGQPPGGAGVSGLPGADLQRASPAGADRRDGL
ncbi:unnamed protein product [Tetraodon nigroviridis]|uniref:(spotted green pufferfish) hypothetical protein n=1 Tax=Tetraodon nigroviridis TaxID=99883 RepID=Q4SMV8_TETNG|nr:unnamed protein product [Tetraodon nigroviridis]